MYQKLHFTGMLLLAGIASAAFSGSIGDRQDNKNLSSPYVLTLSVGPAWANPGLTQTLPLVPDVKKAYVAKNSTTTIADGELFFGLQRRLKTQLDAQLGLAVAVTSQAQIAGTIWDDALAQFNNYTYQYTVQHTHVAIKGKLLKEMWRAFTPYLGASLGVGLNQARGFTNTPIIPEAVTMPNFSTKTTTAVTYTIGAGIQHPITTHWSGGIGYEFADWGRSQLGAASGQTIGQGLVLNHLYTNELQFNITYLH